MAAVVDHDVERPELVREAPKHALVGLITLLDVDTTSATATLVENVETDDSHVVELLVPHPQRVRPEGWIMGRSKPPTPISRSRVDRLRRRWNNSS